MGQHCFPKCSSAESKKHLRKIEEKIASKPQYREITHKEFLKLVKDKYNICGFSEVEYRRNVYKEPLSSTPKTDKLSVAEVLTLTLLWVSRWEEQVVDEKIVYSWKGYDFDILKQLLARDLITYSYKSKKIMFRDKGLKIAPKVAKNVVKELQKMSKA